MRQPKLGEPQITLPHNRADSAVSFGDFGSPQILNRPCPDARGRLARELQEHD